MSWIWILVGVTAISAAYAMLVAMGTYWMARRSQFVSCPEIRRQVLVKIDPKRSLRVLFCGGRQKVVACSRWPKRADCDRACERDIGS